MLNHVNIKRFLHLGVPLFMLASMGLAACAPAASQLESTSWALTSIRDEAGDMTPAVPGSVVTALFQTDQVSGVAGCNNYSGNYQVDGNKLSFGPLATTRQACPDLEVGRQEDAFLTALGLVESYRTSGGRLEMRDGKGDTLLVFETL